MNVTHVLLVILFAVIGTASAEEAPLTAKQILQKMVKAMAVSNYQGTVVFLKNDKLEAMKYFHTSAKDKEQERLVSLNSPPREIVRDSDEIKCLYKLTQQVIIDHRPYEHSFIVDVPKDLDVLDASYQFELVGEEDVAMLPSYVVAIKPKDDFRYVRKIWIAKEQLLPMKAVVYGLGGLVLEQVVFTEIQIKKPPTTKLKEAAGVPVQSHETDIAAMDASSQAAFEVTALPQGFKQIFFSRKPLHKSDQPVDHVLLSDGFASVSVYLEAKKADTAADASVPEGIHSVGAINSMSRTLADSQLTVLGEVPAPTIKFISEGVKLRNSAP
jgi:sigma-E factor negative regulatory protein RseB